MSTRTIISAKMKGKVHAIYCHHDGYPDHIAPLFLDTYNTQEKIEAPIALGDTSAIYGTLEECDPYTKYGEELSIEITDEWVRHDDFLYEYFWDGEQWLFCYSREELKPLSTWRERK